MDDSPEIPVVEENWPRYFIRLAYDGTRYHGWQRQINGHSVQAELESALRKLIRQEKVITTGCGRTDTGVHAKDFYAHFNAFSEISSMDEIVFRLNHILPKDMAVYELFRVRDRAHARFDAIERAYEYHISTRRDPFSRDYAMWYPWELNVSEMQQAAALLVRKGDFASFCKTGGAQKTTICDVREAQWIQSDQNLVFRISADRFLRNMVRAVVGTLLEVGRGKRSAESIHELLEGKSRSLAGESVWPGGLFLTRIEYPADIYPESQDELKK